MKLLRKLISYLESIALARSMANKYYYGDVMAQFYSESSASERAKNYFQGLGGRGYNSATASAKWIAPETLFDQFSKHAKTGAKATLLELGAGTGQLTKLFNQASTDFTITALDISPNMLAELSKMGVADEITEWDVQQDGIPYPSESFDVVASCGMFEFIDQPKSVIKEIARVLAPGGYVTMTGQDHCGMISAVPYLTLQNFKDLLEEAGLEVLAGKTEKAYSWSSYHYLTARKPSL